MSLGLYIHIPFCVSKCPYCDFASVSGRDDLSERYVSAVVREVREQADRLFQGTARFDTVFFGGGTPTSLRPREIGGILEAVASIGGWRDGAEITVEANPGTVDADKFRDLRRLGVNRLSLGIQSFDDGELRFLGRAHSASEAVRAYRAARDAGYGNVNLDLIFALPGQTVEGWAGHLDRALDLGPEHLAVYNLTIEPGTEFGRLHRGGHLRPPAEESQADLYAAAIDRLKGAGYAHYEISNFARPGFAARHNLGYWDGSDYLGVGVSAHSFVGGRRFWNVRGLTEYIERIEAEGTAIGGEETPTVSERASEALLLGLRLVDRGTPLSPFLNDPAALRRLERMESRNMVERVGDMARLTRQGVMVADAVMVELIG